MHWGITLFLHDGTNTYITRQENDHYVLHNAAVTTTTSNRCPTYRAHRVCSPDKKRGLAVCEPTGGSILARVGFVWEMNYTSKLPIRIVP